MKRKIVILSLFILLLTGCDVKYKLNYTNDIFSETLEIYNLSGYEEQVKNMYEYDISTNYDDISDYTKEDGLAYGYTYYQKKLIEDNGLKLLYSYNFNSENYKNSRIAKNFYNNLLFKDNRLFTGKLSDVFTNYPALNQITIEFRTDKFVGYSNADKIENNIHYWYITKNNYESKKPELIFSDKNNNLIENLEDELNDITKSNFDYKLIYVILGILLLFIGFCILIKVKNSNKK